MRVAGPTFLITTVAAGAFWLIGDDPARYDDLSHSGAIAPLP